MVVSPATISPFLLKPDFGAPFDPQDYLGRVPERATLKGLFFDLVLKQVSRQQRQEIERRVPSGRLERRYGGMRDYALRDHMHVLIAAADVLHPNLPRREALRRFGWQVYDGFSKTMVGRMLFGLVGGDIETVLRAGPKAFHVSLKPGRIEPVRDGDRHWRWEFRDLYGFTDTYYVGIIEGAIQRHGARPDVRYMLRTESDGYLDVRWS